MEFPSSRELPLNEVFNYDKLKKLIKQFSQSIPYAKIGILQEDTGRKGEKYTTNADIGAIHEFGSPSNNIPQRSFLRVPLADKMQVEIDKLAKQKDVSLKDLTYKLGAIGKAVVQGAFMTTGYGQWAPSKRTIGKLNGNTLVDTGQLRDSINFEVVE